MCETVSTNYSQSNVSKQKQVDYHMKLTVLLH